MLAHASNLCDSVPQDVQPLGPTRFAHLKFWVIISTAPCSIAVSMRYLLLFLCTLFQMNSITDQRQRRASPLGLSSSSHHSIRARQTLDSIYQIIITNIMSIAYGPESQRVTCPSCSALIKTVTHDKAGLLTYLVCACICFTVVGVLGCCLIPFCCRGCKDIEHYCPNCRSYLGVYKRI